jgi:TrmH family RNA methyltransferase
LRGFFFVILPFLKIAMKQITSVQNTYIKSLVQLQEKSKIRKQTGTFLIEGKREIELAIKGGYIIDTVIYLSEMISDKELDDLISLNDVEKIEISKEVYQKLAYRDTTEGVLAIAQLKSLLLSDLKLPKNPLILVLESIEKPGNIGAMLRTADAANIDAVIIANPKSDLYNPNIIRSSVGCVFTNQIAVCTTSEAIAYLKAKNIAIYSATLQNSNEYYKENYVNATALVVGTEATGISEEFRNNSTQNIIIPMQGVIDSMNVSVAAAILLFEVKRQRGF